jgi:hypothetical protein
VRHRGGGDHLNRRHLKVADVLDEALASAEDDRHHVQEKVVDEAGAEELLDGVRAAADPHVATAGSVPRLPQR